MKKTLNGKWQFRKVGDKLYKEATVPGCNYLDLMANGDIPDPFIGLNEKDVYWVGEKMCIRDSSLSSVSYII